MVRSSRPEALVEPMRRAVGEIDPNIPVQMLYTAERMKEIGSQGMELITTILAGFSVLGLFLSALGLYGVISRLVTQRTPEIGVRLALGAQLRDVVWLVLGSGLRLSAVGMGIGLVGSVLVGFALQAAFPGGNTGLDVRTLVVVTTLLMVVSLVATYLPARRATKVNPLEALRAE
jgi:putative ABC transport system permease protein